MHVWLNGAFGVGKTTTAERLRALAPAWRSFDPEWVGYMLRANLDGVPFDDFQDLAPWRSLVPRVFREVADLTGDELVAVQTVLRQPYWDELRSGLANERIEVLHVVLDADGDTLRDRIQGDTAFLERIEAGLVDRSALDFRLRRVGDYVAARPWLLEAADLVVDTTAAGPDEVAAEVAAAMAARPTS